MWQLAQRFWTQEQGQDITEFSLLLAFVILAAAGDLSGEREFARRHLDKHE